MLGLELGVVGRLVAGLQVGQACGVFLLSGFRIGSSSHQVPRHQTSMCDSDVKYYIKKVKLNFSNH